MKRSRRVINTLLPKRSDGAASMYEADILPAVILNLADRISTLAGLARVEPATHGASTLCIFEFRGTGNCESATDAKMPFATVDLAGRITLDASDNLHNEILRSNWGYAENGRITTHAPRDEVEASIIWRILLMAYFDAHEVNSPYATRPCSAEHEYLVAEAKKPTRGMFF